jgi:hypothetical protein
VFPRSQQCCLLIIRQQCPSRGQRRFLPASSHHCPDKLTSQCSHLMTRTRATQSTAALPEREQAATALFPFWPKMDFGPVHCYRTCTQSLRAVTETAAALTLGLQALNFLSAPQTNSYPARLCKTYLGSFLNISSPTSGSVRSSQNFVCLRAPYRNLLSTLVCVVHLKCNQEDLYDCTTQVQRTICEVLSEFRLVHILQEHIFSLFPPLHLCKFSIASISRAHPHKALKSRR